MNFIFEGPKGCGKTTAIKKLSQYVGDCEVVHATKDTPNNYLWHQIYLVKGSNASNIIFDRFYFGELIYPYLENRGRKINLKQVIQLQSEFSPTTIMGYSSDDDLLISRVRERDGGLKPDDAQKIIESNRTFKYLAWLMKQYDEKNFYSLDVAKYSMLDFITDKFGTKENA